MPPGGDPTTDDPFNTETDEGTIAMHKKRARRVSFAELTSVHVFVPDSENDTPTDPEPPSPDAKLVQSSNGFRLRGQDSADSEYSKESTLNDEDGDDDVDDECSGRRLFLQPMESPSPGGSTLGSASSNYDDDFFGPVSANFIRPGRLSDSAVSDESHDRTMDSTAFSMHFRSLVRSDSGDMTAPTAFQLSLEERTPITNSLSTTLGNSMTLTTVKNTVSDSSACIDRLSNLEGSSGMSLVGEDSHRYDYAKLSPGLDALLAEGQKELQADVVHDNTSVAKSPISNRSTPLLSDVSELVRSPETVTVSKVKLNDENNGFLPCALAEPADGFSSDDIGKAPGTDDLIDQGNSPPEYSSRLRFVSTPIGLTSRSLARYEVIEHNGSISSVQRSMSRLKMLETSPFSASVKIRRASTSASSYLSKARPPTVVLGDVQNTTCMDNVAAVSSNIKPYKDPFTPQKNDLVFRMNQNPASPEECIDSHSNSLTLHARDNANTCLGHDVDLGKKTEHGSLSAIPANDLDTFSASRQCKSPSLCKSETSTAAKSVCDRDVDQCNTRDVSESLGNDTTHLIEIENQRTHCFPSDTSLQVQVDHTSEGENEKETSSCGVDSQLSYMTCTEPQQQALGRSPLIPPANHGEDANLFENIVERKRRRDDMMSSKKDPLDEIVQIQSSSKLHKVAGGSETLDLMKALSRSPLKRQISKMTNNEGVHSLHLPPTSHGEDANLFENIVEKKRRRDDMISSKKDPLDEIVQIQSSPKLCKVASGSETLVEQPEESANEMFTRQATTKLKHWNDIFSKFVADKNQLVSPLHDKASLQIVGQLLDLLVQQQRLKQYEFLHREILPKQKVNLDNHQQKRVAEARTLLQRIAHKHAGLQLMSVKREMLQKKLQLVNGYSREFQILKSKFQSSSSVPCTRSPPIDKCNNHSAKSESNHEVSSDKVNAMRHILEASSRKIFNLTKFFHTAFKIKGEPASIETTAQVNDLLKRIVRCRILSQYLKLWQVDDIENSNTHQNAVLNYHNIIAQRFAIDVGSVTNIVLSNSLNENTILKNFPNMNAVTAFAFVLTTHSSQKVGYRSLSQGTQITGSVLGNLLDVIEEVQQTRIKIPNLISSNFYSPSAEELELRICFLNFRNGKKVAFALNLSCLSWGIYPTEAIPLELKDVAEDLTKVRDAIQSVEAGYSRIFRLCSCVSELVEGWSG